MKIGAENCKVESMTETEILCRTNEGTEEPASFIERVFTEHTEDRGISDHYKMKTWSTSIVANSEECIRRCRIDAACLAYSFSDAGKGAKI